MNPQHQKLIINADDFGYNPDVSKAIAECFTRKLINSTSMIVNFPNFENAVELAFQNNFQTKIGLHINLMTGHPLTDLTDTLLVDKKGAFNKILFYNPFIILKKGYQHRIKNELHEQYLKLLNSGINPTHLNSHFHLHKQPILSKLFVNFAIERHLKLRLIMNLRRKNFFKTIYFSLENKKLRRLGINFTDMLGTVSSAQKYFTSKKTSDISFEVMVHPSFEKNILIDIEEKNDIEKEILALKETFRKHIYVIETGKSPNQLKF